ncbi:MAG: Dabb family protein [Saprospiraceae bacterium]
MNYRSFLANFCFGASCLFFIACANEGNVSSEMVEEVNIEKTIDGDAMPGLMHVVHFWLADGLSEAEEKDFLKGVWSLEGIPSVQYMFVGPPASTPSRGVVDNSFDYAMVAYFDDVKGHDAYQIHPIHLKFVAEHEAKFKTVQVKDHAPANR